MSDEKSLHKGVRAGEQKDTHVKKKGSVDGITNLVNKKKDKGGGGGGEGTSKEGGKDK